MSDRHSQSSLGPGHLANAWSNKSDHDHVVALTEHHVITSLDTRTRRGSRRLIEQWRATTSDQWSHVEHVIDVREIRHMRSSVRQNRLTVATDDAVLTMRGFQPTERRRAAAAIAERAGLVIACSAGLADWYGPPGERPARFVGDSGPSDAPSAPVRIVSPFCRLGALTALALAATQVPATVEASSAAERAVLAIVVIGLALIATRLWFVSLSLDERGVEIRNVWSRQETRWADITEIRTTEVHFGNRHMPGVSFATTHYANPPGATATVCLTRAQAQRVAEQIASVGDTATAVGSSVFADDLRMHGRPTSSSKRALTAGSLHVFGRPVRGAIESIANSSNRAL